MHWDVTIPENKKYQDRYMGKDLGKKVNFPDILILSEKKKDFLMFQVWGGIDNEAKLMEEFDTRTMGRLIPTSCDDIMKLVDDHKKKVFAFFGDTTLLKRNEENAWAHVTDMSYNDRRLMWRDPI